jgi:hypothetical protein
MWVGTRDAGKTTLCNLIAEAVGPDLMTTINPRGLEFQKTVPEDAEKAAAWKQSMRHRRLAVAHEVSCSRSYIGGSAASVPRVRV